MVEGGVPGSPTFTDSCRREKAAVQLAQLHSLCPEKYLNLQVSRRNTIGDSLQFYRRHHFPQDSSRWAAAHRHPCEAGTAGIKTDGPGLSQLPCGWAGIQLIIMFFFTLSEFTNCFSRSYHGCSVLFNRSFISKMFFRHFLKREHKRNSFIALREIPTVGTDKLQNKLETKNPLLKYFTVLSF